MEVDFVTTDQNIISNKEDKQCESVIILNVSSDDVQMDEPSSKTNGTQVDETSSNTNGTQEDDSTLTLKNDDDPNLAAASFTGLINQGFTCYLNTLMQTLFMTPEFRNEVWGWTENIAKPGTVSFQLHKLFVNLKITPDGAIGTSTLRKSIALICTDDEQQDVHEIKRVLFESIEKEIADVNLTNIKNLYEGTLIDYVKCLQCGNIRSKKESFEDISLSIRQLDNNTPYETVEEALKAFIMPDILSGENQYECDHCNCKSDAQKGFAFLKIPYVLILQLKRFDFQNGSRIKLNDRITFPHILDLNELMQTNRDLIQTVLLDNSPDFETPKRLTRSKTKKTGDNNIYELYYVVMHAGIATAGHYYAYIKSFETSIWYKFDDRKVSKVTNDFLQEAFGRGPGTPYCNTNAYLLGYRSVDQNINNNIVESAELPNNVKNNIDSYLPPQPYYADKREDLVKLKIWHFPDDDKTSDYIYNTTSITLFRRGFVTLHEVKLDAIGRFMLSSVSEELFSLVKYDEDSKQIECPLENENVSIGEIMTDYSMCLLLKSEANSIDSIDLTSDHDFVKVYKLHLLAIVANEIVKISAKCTVGEFRIMITELFNIEADNGLLILDLFDSCPMLLTDNMTLLRDLGDITKSRYYITTDATCADVKEFKNSLLYESLMNIKKIMSMTFTLPHNCANDNYRQEKNQNGLHEENKEDTSNLNLFYQGKVVPNKRDTNATCEILMHMDVPLSFLYEKMGTVVTVNKDCIKIYYTKSEDDDYKTLVPPSADTVGEFFRREDYSYSTSVLLLLEIQDAEEKAIVAVLAISNPNNPFTHTISVEVKKPCKIGTIKKLVVNHLSKNYSLQLKLDLCRLRKRFSNFVSTVYPDSQELDDCMKFENRYSFCIQTVPCGQKLYSLAMDAKFIFVIRFNIATQELEKPEEIFLKKGTDKEFIEKLETLSNIPLEYLSIYLGETNFPCKISMQKLNSKSDWLLLRNKNIYWWERDVTVDGKVVFYRDYRCFNDATVK